jgi:DNA-directed RNA polymerase subunit RPC12/RpoP
MAQSRSIPCALCSRPLEQREDKNGKPYFVCDECGTQFFIRGVVGKERLAKLLRSCKGNGLGAKIATLVEELESLQSFIEEFFDGEEIILKNDDGLEESVPFMDWSRSICERVAAELGRPSKGRS